MKATPMHTQEIPPTRDNHPVCAIGTVKINYHTPQLHMVALHEVEGMVDPGLLKEAWAYFSHAALGWVVAQYGKLPTCDDTSTPYYVFFGIMALVSLGGFLTLWIDRQARKRKMADFRKSGLPMENVVLLRTSTTSSAMPSPSTWTCDS